MKTKGGNAMPYETLKQLPESVRENLPKHAQEIYQAAYNNAWDEYHHDEQRAHRVAWSAVNKSYVKNESSGKWVKKSD